MNWRGLLVSVRDATEAAAAVEGGAAIIDVKEPRRGSLGPAEPEAIAAVAEVVGASRPWTMACGELGGMSAAGPGRAGAAGIDSVAVAIGDRVARVFSLLSDNAVAPAAVKIGLAGAAATDWRQRLGAVYESLPTGSERVAVAYADWRQAGAPAPPQVIAAAADLGCSTLLIDTFDKSAGGLFACCQPELPAAWVALARAAGLGVVLAGRVMPAEIAVAWALGPDVVALRSAVCSNGRLGSVQAGLVREAVRLCAAAEAAAWSRHPPPRTGEQR
jgi:uncharacterized protein (UPF0264 family)